MRLARGPSACTMSVGWWMDVAPSTERHSAASLVADQHPPMEAASWTSDSKDGRTTVRSEGPSGPEEARLTACPASPQSQAASTPMTALAALSTDTSFSASQALINSPVSWGTPPVSARAPWIVSTLRLREAPMRHQRCQSPAADTAHWSLTPCGPQESQLALMCSAESRCARKRSAWGKSRRPSGMPRTWSQRALGRSTPTAPVRPPAQVRLAAWEGSTPLRSAAVATWGSTQVETTWA
mmetsp:Transcript_1054/g.3295  ORF Transcript_1054/g.3295 Transcript_1054/m.3295 type:complete len:240 (+) Transcript_1054:1083-1802(+)